VLFPRLFILVILFCVFAITAFSQSFAIISGKIINAKSDSVSFIYGAETRQGITVKAPLVNDSFFIRLKINEPCHIDITDGLQYISGLIEKNDNILIQADFKNNKTARSIEGIGKGKFIYIMQRTNLFPIISGRGSMAKVQKNPVDYLLSITDSAEKAFVTQLNSYKSDMSKEAYLILRGDIAGHLWQVRSRIPGLVYGIPLGTLIHRNSDSISIKFKEAYQSFFGFEETYNRSSIYVLTVAGALNTEYKMTNPKRQYDFENKYSIISQRLPASLKKPVANRLLPDDIKAHQNKFALEKVIREIFKNPADRWLKEQYDQRLDDIFSMEAGKPAPDFMVENEKGEKLRLADFKGKVIFMDFWFAGCPPCIQLFKQLQPVKEHFKNDTRVVFLNISIDKKTIWKNAMENLNIEGYHVYTEDKEASHPMISDFRVYGYPTNRLLDKKGKFFVIAPSHDPEELMKEINAAFLND
jgi:peroxiredoxin